MTHYRSGLYRPAFRLLSLIGLLLVTAPLNVTRGAPVVSTTNGYSITSQQGSTTITSLLSPSGIAATQSSTTNGTSGPAIRGAIARYNDGRVFALDYSTMTYVANSLGAAVDHRNAEYSLLYSAVPAYDGGPAITPPAVPPASLQATSLTASIGGAPAAAYLMNYGGKQWRLWYATTLPVPPANIRSALAALEPGGSPATGGAYHVYLPAVGSPNGGPPAGVSPANDVAGRIVLRAELMTGSTWTIVVDTQNVQPANVPDSTFSPPAGFHPGSAHGSSRSSQTAPSVRHGPVQPQDVQANVLQGPGPVSSHPEIYAFYWGNTFNDPSHAPAVSNISQSIPTFYSSGYEGPLAQYGIQSGGLQNTYLVNNDPTAGVGSSDVPAVEAFILNESLTTSAPMFWWEYSGHDPIYTVFVAQSTVDTSSWSGYHFVAPSLNHAVLPFPLSLFVHDAMPYTVIKVPDAALGTQLEAQLYRSQCASSSPPSFCPALAALDKATATGAHEFVEAASDPYPFLGGSIRLRIPGGAMRKYPTFVRTRIPGAQRPW